MNCEQTLNNLPHFVADDTPGGMSPPVPQGTSRRALLEHLRICPQCQIEYEALWHTADTLQNVDPPVPPPDLVRNIQQCIRDMHQRKLSQFLANPLTWCLHRLKVPLSPRVIVNVTALLCLLIAASATVKLTLFNDPPTPESGLTAMRNTLIRNIRISTSPWGVIKDTESEAGAGDTPVGQRRVTNQRSPHSLFNAQQTAPKMWYTAPIDTAQQATETDVTSYFPGTAIRKLTIFWDHIKTEL